MDREMLPRMPAIFRAMTLMALGVREVEVWRPQDRSMMKLALRDEDGNPIVRMGPEGDEVLVDRALVPLESGPDFRAGKYCVDRYLGLPRQSVEINDVPRHPDMGEGVKEKARRELSEWMNPRPTGDDPSST